MSAPTTGTGRRVANAERVAMAAALYEAKFVCDYGEDVDRLMDVLLHRGFVLSLDDGSGLFSDKIAAAIEAEAIANYRASLAEQVRGLGKGQTRVDHLTGYMGWDYQKAIAAVLALIEGKP